MDLYDYIKQNKHYKVNINKYIYFNCRINIKNKCFLAFNLDVLGLIFLKIAIGIMITINLLISVITGILFLLLPSAVSFPVLLNL